MRRSLSILACVAAVGGCGSSDPQSAAPLPEAQKRALAGAPPPLASLHRESNQLLEGGRPALRARLRELRGYPVVVNKWASWCPPCRGEFPFFQRLSVRLGRRVAFIGVDSQDNDAAARKFLREFPVSYPHYKDPNSEVAEVFHAVGAFPATAFYDRSGRLAYLHQGGYSTERRLAADIRRYALR